MDARAQSRFDLGSSLPSHLDFAYPILIVWRLSLVTSVAPAPKCTWSASFPAARLSPERTDGPWRGRLGVPQPDGMLCPTGEVLLPEGLREERARHTRTTRFRSAGVCPGQLLAPRFRQRGEWRAACWAEARSYQERFGLRPRHRGTSLCKPRARCRCGRDTPFPVLSLPGG